MKKIAFIFTILFTTCSFAQEIECSENYEDEIFKIKDVENLKEISILNLRYEYEILEIKDEETLKEISKFYLSKKGICDVQFAKRNSDFFIIITTTIIVDENSINILNNSAFNKFHLKFKKCEHE